jgi:hypothetical protein
MNGNKMSQSEEGFFAESEIFFPYKEIFFRNRIICLKAEIHLEREGFSHHK